MTTPALVQGPAASLRAVGGTRVPVFAQLRVAGTPSFEELLEGA